MNNYEYFSEKKPDSIKDSSIFDKVYASIGRQLDKLLRDKEDLILQLNPQTCTWTIDMWEDMCGIEHSTKPIEVRRANVVSKLSQISPITRLKVENIVKNFDKDGYVENIPGQYIFRINLNVECNSDIYQLRKIIEDIKPCHLAYILKYFMLYKYFYKIDFKSFINVYIKFYSSAFNAKTNLLLDGSCKLDGQYYLSASSRPCGINQHFYFMDNINFVTENLINLDLDIKILMSMKSKNTVSQNVNGGLYRFKALDGSSTLDGSIMLNNETILLKSI